MFPARSVTPLFETIPRPRSHHASNHVSDSFYVVAMQILRVDSA